MSWLLILVLCCGLLLAVLAVMTSQRPVVGGLAIAAMVLMTLAAFFAARPRGLTGFGSERLQPRVPRVSVPAIPDFDHMEHPLTLLARQQEELATQKVQEVWDRIAVFPAETAEEESGLRAKVGNRTPRASTEVRVLTEPRERSREHSVRNLVRVAQVGDAPQGRRAILFSVLMAVAIAALLYVGYLFLDASTRGHFTWPLRILSVVAFSVICAALVAVS